MTRGAGRRESCILSANANLLFVEHRRELVDYAAGIVGSRTHAEDLVQEAWIRFNEAATRELLREPRNYLYRIVRNLALDGRRRLEVERRIFRDSPPDFVDSLPDGTPSVEKTSVARDDLRLLQEALLELPKRTRIAFEMHRIQGCKLREIAAVLDVSVPTAQLLVMDGLQHCKARLGWLG